MNASPQYIPLNLWSFSCVNDPFSYVTKETPDVKSTHVEYILLQMKHRDCSSPVWMDFHSALVTYKWEATLEKNMLLIQKLKWAQLV